MQYTAEEALDKLWEHFVINRNPAGINPVSGCCRYKSEEGQKCGIGIFINDQDYKKTLEFCSLREVMETCSIEFIGTEDLNLTGLYGDLRFSDAVRHAHDSAAICGLNLKDFSSRIQRNLEELYKQCNVKIPDRSEFIEENIL